MTRRLNLYLLAIMLILGLPTYWLMIDSGPHDATAKSLSIAELREIAASVPGNAPESIRYEAVGRSLRMNNLSAAGTGFRLSSIFALVYRVDYPEKRPVVIGSGLTSEQAQALGFSEFDKAAQERVFAAMRKASDVVTLGSETTQTGGLKSLMQHRGEEPDARHQDNIVMGKTPRNGGRPFALAPGIVVIPTPARMPGSRLVFVRLANGREYIFAGSLARMSPNWEEPRVPARIITDFVQPENRREAYSWLLTLRELKRQSPSLVIVPGSRIPKNNKLKRNFPGYGAINNRLEIDNLIG